MHAKIAELGPRSIYEGRIAKEIVEVVARAGGNLTMDDFRRHETSFPDPVKTNYRGIDVRAPPNGQGLCALLGLNILTESPLKHGKAPYSSATRLHYQIEAMRLAFSDARHYITDMESEKHRCNPFITKIHRTAESIDPPKQVDPKEGSPLSSSDTVSFQVVTSMAMQFRW